MKIGILTMHKVLNYGSALQAYALQHYISSLGHDAELIDYIFPNGSRIARLTLKQRLTYPVKSLLSGKLRKKLRFQKFYKKYFVCSDERFNSPEELSNAKFDYDILMTGSDQVWNPKHIKDDYSFFLPFASEGTKKVSYASSFSTAEIPDELNPIYRKFLDSYSAISVREKSGVKIVKELVGKDAEMVCDPTLLLSQDEWSGLIKDMPNPIGQPYILAYILRYAYDPYPEINRIIDEVQKELGFHLVILDGSLADMRRKNATVIKNAGPLEFLNLVKNASFIITTSFHGTAFALNFGIPFYSVIKDRSGFDTRMIDLLEISGNLEHAVILNQIETIHIDAAEAIHTGLLDKFKSLSKKYLDNIMPHYHQNF